MSPSPDGDLRRRDAGEQMGAGLAGSGLKELGTDGVMASCLAVVEFLQLSFHRYTGWPSQAGGLTFCFLFFCDIPIPFRQCQLTLHLYLG